MSPTSKTTTPRAPGPAPRRLALRTDGTVVTILTCRVGGEQALMWPLGSPPAGWHLGLLDARLLWPTREVTNARGEVTGFQDDAERQTDDRCPNHR